MLTSKNWLRDAQMWQQGNSAELVQDFASMGMGLWELYNKRQAAKEGGSSGFTGSEASHNIGLAVGEVVAFTGCRSDQTSADVGNVNQNFNLAAGGSRTSDHSGGALTAAFLESLDQHFGSGLPASELSYIGLL